MDYISVKPCVENKQKYVSINEAEGTRLPNTMTILYPGDKAKLSTDNSCYVKPVAAAVLTVRMVSSDALAGRKVRSLSP